MEVTFWEEGQPNNQNAMGENEDCVQMMSKHRSPQRLWNDHVCLSKEGDNGVRPLCQIFF